MVDLVVDLAEEGDEAVVVDLLFLGVEGGAGAERVEDVVDAGEGEVGKQGLLPLAVRVEPLAEVAELGLQGAFFEGGEGEGVEAAVLCVTRTIFKSSHQRRAPRLSGPYLKELRGIRHLPCICKSACYRRVSSIVERRRFGVSRLRE